MESRGPICQHKYGKVTVGALMKAMLVGTTDDNVRAALAEGAESTGCVSVPASRHRAGSSGIVLDGDWHHMIVTIEVLCGSLARVAQWAAESAFDIARSLQVMGAPALRRSRHPTVKHFMKRSRRQWHCQYKR